MGRIWNITIYRLVVISGTIRGTVHRKPEKWQYCSALLTKSKSIGRRTRAYRHSQKRKARERENLYVGIWIIVPAPIVVPGQVLLDLHPGTLDRVDDSTIEL